MVEFERSGHWRTLSDGTRTWVNGHSVIRGITAAGPEYADHVLQARKEAIEEKVRKRKAAEETQGARKKAKAAARLLHTKLLKEARQARKLQAQRSLNE